MMLDSSKWNINVFPGGLKDVWVQWVVTDLMLKLGSLMKIKTF